MKNLILLLIAAFYSYSAFTQQKNTDTIREFDIVINEIMADPTPEVSLPAYEYVELYNRTSADIILRNWSFAYGNTLKKIDSALIPSKGYLLLSHKNSAPELSVYGKIYGFSAFSLNNEGQTLVLKDENGKVVHAVSYTIDWYGSDYKKDGGWSLEQIDPSNPCSGQENWKASVDKIGGTPCRKNSVFDSNPDNSIPDIERVSVIDSTDITLVFSEPLDSTSLLDNTKYSVDNNIGYPSKIQLVSPFYNSVNLLLSAPLKKNIIYHITISGKITDCAGNESESDISVRFALPFYVEPGDIIINEILTNPKNNGAQFIEIYNRSQKVLDLKDMLLSSMDTVNNILISQKVISADAYLFFPGEYIVLSTDPLKVKQQYFTSNPHAFIPLSSFPQFNIDDGIVVISDKPGLIIDKLVYTPDMQYPLLTDTKGVSLERVSFNLQTQDKSNWHSAAQSVGYATPAYKNSQYTDTKATDNEVEVTPEIFSPDNDGRDDVLSINYHLTEPGYTANITIFDAKGRKVRTLVNNELLGTTGTFIWDGLNDDKEKALIGIYIIYFEAFNLKGKVKHYKKTAVLGGKI